MSGAGAVADGVGYLAGKLGFDNAKSALYEAGQSTRDYWDNSMSNEGKYVANNRVFTEDGGSIGLGETPIQSAFMGIAESAAPMVAAIPLGAPIGLAARGLMGTAAATEGVAALTAQAARVSPKLANIVQGVAKNAPGALAGSIVEGGQAALTNAASTEQEILDPTRTPQAVLDQNPRYQEAFARTGDANAARKEMAGLAADDVAQSTLFSTGGIGLATGGGVMGTLANKMLRKGATEVAGEAAKKGAMTFAKGLATSTGKEAGQEFFQSGAENYLQQSAKQTYADTSINPMEGTLSASLEGAAVGGLMGLGGGAFAPVANKRIGRTPEAAAPVALPTQQEAAAQAHANVMQAPETQLIQNPAYVEALTQTGDADQARSIVAEQEARKVKRPSLYDGVTDDQLAQKFEELNGRLSANPSDKVALAAVSTLGAEIEARKQDAIDPEVLRSRATPKMAIPAPTGSFGKLNEFSDLLDSERQDQTQRISTIQDQRNQEFNDLVNQEQQGIAQQRNGIASKQQQAQFAGQLADTDARVQGGMQQEAIDKRNAVLDDLLQSPNIQKLTPEQIGNAYRGTLERNGFTNTEIQPEEAAKVQKFTDVRDAQALPVAEPEAPAQLRTAPNEMDSRLVREKKAPAAPLAPNLQRVDELIAKGAVVGKINGKPVLQIPGKKGFMGLSSAQHEHALKSAPAVEKPVKPPKVAKTATVAEPMPEPVLPVIEPKSADVKPTEWRKAMKDALSTADQSNPEVKQLKAQAVNGITSPEERATVLAKAQALPKVAQVAKPDAYGVGTDKEPIKYSDTSAVNLADGIDAFVGKNAENGQWTVIEKTTGKSLSSNEQTEKAAITSAKKAIDTHGADKLKAILGKTEKVDQETLHTKWTESSNKKENAAPTVVEPKVEAVSPEPTAPAVHVEGKKVEPVTPIVIAQSLTKSAKNTDMDLREAKAALLTQIEVAINNAKAEDAETNKQATELSAAAADAQKLRTESKYSNETKKHERIATDEQVAAAEDRLMKARDAIGYLTFDVKGDGKFKIKNTKEKLAEFKKKISASTAFNPVPKSKDTPFNLPNTPTSSIAQMLEDGEKVSAHELAKTIGKPFGFARDNKREPLLYTDTSPVDLMPGLETFVGKSADKHNSAGKWAVIEKSTGYSIGDFASTKEAAITGAKAKLKTVDAATLLGRFANMEKPGQDALEAKWLEAAQKSDDSIATGQDVEAAAQSAKRTADNEKFRADQKAKAEQAAVAKKVDAKAKPKKFKMTMVEARSIATASIRYGAHVSIGEIAKQKAAIKTRLLRYGMTDSDIDFVIESVLRDMAQNYRGGSMLFINDHALASKLQSMGYAGDSMPETSSEAPKPVAKVEEPAKPEPKQYHTEVAKEAQAILDLIDKVTNLQQGQSLATRMMKLVKLTQSFPEIPRNLGDMLTRDSDHSFALPSVNAGKGTFGDKSNVNQLKATLQRLIDSSEKEYSPNATPVVEAAPNATYDFPAHGLEIQDGELTGSGYTKVIPRIVEDALSQLDMKKITLSMPTMYAYFLPSTDTHQGALRLVDENITVPQASGWKLLTGKQIRPASLTKEQLSRDLSNLLSKEPILSSKKVETKTATQLSTNTTTVTPGKNSSDVSSRDGQMYLAARAGVIASINTLNSALEKISPLEAVSGSSIENASNSKLDELREELSVKLIAAQKRNAKPESPVHLEGSQSYADLEARGKANDTKVDALSDADTAAVYEAMGLAGGKQSADKKREMIKAEHPDDVEAGLAAVADKVQEEPSNDRNSITFERSNGKGEVVTETFKRGDFVSIYLSPGKDIKGEVSGISHANGELKVGEQWHEKGTVYHAEKPTPIPVKKTALSSVLESANAKTGEGLTDADMVINTDIKTLEDHKNIMKLAGEGKISVESIKSAYASMKANEEAIKAGLSSKKKDELLKAGGYNFAANHKSDNKDQIVRSLFSDMMNDFAYLSSDSFSYGFGEGQRRKAIDTRVDGLTQESLTSYAEASKKKVAEAKAWMEERMAKMKAQEAGAENPVTLSDFQTNIGMKKAEGKTFAEARMMLTLEQRAQFDTLAGESTRAERAKNKVAKQEQTMRAPGETLTAGETIKTKHTKHGHDLWQFNLDQRVSKEEYQNLSNQARRLGGDYSSYRGNGAIPGWQFKTPEAAQAFKDLIAGDNTAAKEVMHARRDAFADDRSQSASERLKEMADALEEDSAESLNRDRKTNTNRRAGMAGRAESNARAGIAFAKTMRNIANLIDNGKAQFLDKVREKKQISLLSSAVEVAQYDKLKSQGLSYSDMEKQKGMPADQETADFAAFPSYTAFRSDLANLARQLLEVDGTKMFGKNLLALADDTSDAYLAFAKANLNKVMTFSKKDGGLAAFSSKAAAESAITRSGYRGQAIAYMVKRGEYAIIQSPSAAIKNGVWSGDGDKRLTLDRDFGAELVEKIGRAARRGNKVSVPWQFEATYDKHKTLSRMNIETAAEYRSALREFIALREQPEEANKVKELERAMVGRQNDGMDFFPTPSAVADEMIEIADIQPGMNVLEPSAGWGHIAERIREAGVEPDVVELSGKRRELLEAKGFNLVGGDFLELKPRKFFTYGDVFRAPDGQLGVMRGSNGMGGSRVGLDFLDENGQPDRRRGGWYSRDDLEGVEHRGTQSGYDRILMNPPFSDRRDAEHVQHAYSLLKPGGRLVAIMGEGVFFGKDKSAEAFREWVESVGGTDEKLAEGTFLDPSLPVNTAVSARMVVIDKASDAPALSRSTDTYMFGIPTETLTEQVTQITENWKNSPKVNVVDSVSDLPFNAPSDARGAFYQGQVYMVASNIRSEAEAEMVLFHEALGHAGLRGVFGNQLNAELRTLATQNKALGNAAAKWRKLNGDIRGQRSEGVWEAISIEEVLADMAGTGKEITGLQKLVSMMQKGLRAIGLNKVADWLENATDAQVMSMLTQARKEIQKGKEPHVFGGEQAQALSRNDAKFSLPTEEKKVNFLAKFWLKVAGNKDLFKYKRKRSN